MSQQIDTRQPVRLLVSLRRATEHGARYPIFDRLRELGPVLRMPRGLVVVGYREVAEVLQDSRRFGPPTPAQLDLADPGWRDHPAALLGSDMVIMQSGADHRAARSAIHQALGGALGGDFATRVEHRIDQAVEELAAEFSRADHVQAVSALTEPLAIGVVADIFGASEIDVAAMLPYVVAFSKTIDGSPLLLSEVEDQAAQKLLDFAARVADGGSILRELPPADVVGLLAPGITNMSSAIGNLIRTLDSFPRERDELLAHPVTPDTAIEELQRYDAPVHGAIRTAWTDTEVAGFPVAVGEGILVFTAAANRDPVQWTEPDVFRPARPGLSQTLAFGHGAHICMGQALIRLVLGRIPARLYGRFPTLRVAEPPSVRPGLFRNHMDRLILTER
jgi:cytochrome P450